jgi:glycosyltransferase 2 family protein
MKYRSWFTQGLPILRSLLLLAIAAGLLFLAFRGVKISSIVHAVGQANLWWVLGSVAFSVVALISRGYRWKLLIEPLGYSPSLQKTTYSLMVGYLANLALPRLGELTRCGSLSKAESIPFSPLLGTVITERLVDLVSLFSCLLLLLVIERNRFGIEFRATILNPIIEPIARHKWLVLLLVIGVAIALIVYRHFQSRQQAAGSFWSKLLIDLVTGLRSITHLRRPWLFVFHTVFIWVSYFLGVYFCFLALPYTASLGYRAAIFALVAGGFGMSAPVQGGIGAYHLLVSKGLMLYGVSQQDGLAFATLVHSLQLLLVLLFGTASLILLFLERRMSRKKNWNQNA